MDGLCNQRHELALCVRWSRIQNTGSGLHFSGSVKGAPSLARVSLSNRPDGTCPPLGVTEVQVACHWERLTRKTGKSSDGAFLEETCHICSCPPDTPSSCLWQAVSPHLFSESLSIFLSPSFSSLLAKSIYREKYTERLGSFSHWANI